MPGLTKNIGMEVAMSKPLCLYDTLCILTIFVKTLYWICYIILFVMFCAGCSVWLSVKSVNNGFEHGVL